MSNNIRYIIIADLDISNPDKECIVSRVTDNSSNMAEKFFLEKIKEFCTHRLDDLDKKTKAYFEKAHKKGKNERV